MHPLLAAPTRLLGYAVLLLALGAAAAALGVLVSAIDWTSALAFALPLALLHGFVALSAYYPCRQFDRRRALALQVLSLTVTAVAASV
ncbi:MAG TPA: hypothetical protein VFY12_06775, partial [Arenimonas sp.]|nr:hypothetical protein [Arenimonas sp.]